MAKPNPTLPTLTAKDIRRFWSKVDIKGPDECWLWKAGKDPDGYGRFSFGPYATNVNLRAHRVAYYLATGKDPGSSLVCHNCPGQDQPACCNPAHLWPGTNADNTKDAADKGRMAAEDRNGARLHPERLARGDRNGARLHPEKIARGLRQGTHTKPESRVKGEKQGLSKLKEGQIPEIRSGYATGGISMVKLGAKYNVSNHAIWSAIHHKTWKHIP